MASTGRPSISHVAATLVICSVWQAAAADDRVIHALTDVKGALNRTYGLKDSTGLQMASLHLLPPSEGPTPADRTYHAVYMTNPPGAGWEVRVANSTDLMSWQFVKSVVPNADMPYPFVLPNGWVLLAHEQWMLPGSVKPSQIGFKLYYSVSDLLAGSHSASFVAPQTLGTSFLWEGTPNIYAAALVKRGGLYTVDVQVGFHYNDPSGVDTVAHGTLTSFGPSSEQNTPRWTTQTSVGYDFAFMRAGCTGNIGQRVVGRLGGSLYMMQEANIGHMPPTVWQDWRLWLYTPAAGEDITGYSGPTGEGKVTRLSPRTDGGSTAFANPAFKVVPCPGKAEDTECVFVSCFIFSSGAENGVLAFVNEAPAAPAPAALLV